MLSQVEYIWLDGALPTPQVRSKTRIVEVEDHTQVEPGSFPRWSFDGSSTYQAEGGDSDLLLEPVRVVKDPVRGEGNYIVLCEVLNADGSPHVTNTRAQLRNVMNGDDSPEDPWVGFEQEYTLFQNGRPMGFPENGYPAPQGPFYCGNGSRQVVGRDLVEDHTKACLDAGLMIYGINAEVMPGQWEFQVGYRGVDGESADPLTVSDHLQIARYLLHKLSESFDIDVRFDAKPVKGDWNGAGAHTNFSTRAMRGPGGLARIKQAIDKLSANHEAHIINYGAGLEERLTGLHETCSIDEFRSGVADRGASIRIPRQVQEKGYGYLEDRRPGANCDPYLVCTLLLTTIGSEDVSLSKAS